MWYKAMKYPNQETARTAWNKLHHALRNLSVDITTSSVIHAGTWYVCALSEVVPATRVTTLIQQCTNDGTDSSLPIEVVNALFTRRLERHTYADRRPGTTTSSYEGHTPTVIGYETTEVSTEETVKQHAKVLIASLYEVGYPFIEIYKIVLPGVLMTTLYEYGRMDTENVTARTREYTDRLRVADKYLVDASGRLMHTSVSDDETEWVDAVDTLWIEHDIPQLLPGVGDSIKAVYVYPVPAYSNVPGYYITIIDEYGYHRLCMVYDTEEKGYTPTIDYVCPYDACKDSLSRIQGVDDKHIAYRQGCTQCLQDCLQWASWLHTMCRMIRRDYATSATPTPFTSITSTYRETRLVPRVYGKGKPKEKKIETSVTYKLVTYDVSLLPEAATSNQPTGEARVNWLTIHGKDARIYRRLHFTNITRRYEGIRYKHLIDRVLRQGRYIEDGREYTLDTTSDTPIVVSTIVDYDKYVPMLRPELRKVQTVKKVVSSKHQHLQEFTHPDKE